MSVENPDLLLRPGMTATADIIVQNVENALLVPNSALRFVPPHPSEGKKPKRGLLRSLMPGPPRRRTSGRHGPAPDSGVDPDKGKTRVWVLKDNHVLPIRVKKMATDGVHTAVESRELEAGMKIILNQVTTKG
jgi:HlyD family secretion protein